MERLTREIDELEEKYGPQPGLDNQRSILDDGVVTEAEYRSAVTRAVECMREEGLLVSPVVDMVVPFGVVTDFYWEPGAVDSESAGTVSDDCETINSLTVATVWTITGEATDLRDAAKSVLDQCFQGQGIDTTDLRTIVDYQSRDDVRDVQRGEEHPCIEKLQLWQHDQNTDAIAQLDQWLAQNAS